MKLLRTFLLVATCGLVLPAARLHATATENNILHIVPTPGAVKIDGATGDWDLSGGIFACDDAERLRDKFSVWFFAMYDQDNLYLLARWKDPTPLNNDQSSKGGHGFAGDCIQIRFISGYKTAEERVSHWMGWRDRDNLSILSTAYDRNFKGPALDNSLDNGAQQAFQIDADAAGYSEEIAIPWKLITASGKAPAPGESLRMAVEPNFSAGPPWGRINIHDIFREGVMPDRVFTFRAYDQWGTGLIEKTGRLPLSPVRLSDDRKFPVTQVEGELKIDWTGLVQKQELPGFKTVGFKTPAEGEISLNIRDPQGNVVRQLLTQHPFEKGAHEVKWDGLTSPRYKTPGEPVAAGTYTWEALSHPPFKLTLRGWAASSGNTPWENGPTSHWGADHGQPDAVATDGEKVYLGWAMAEAGKGILGCDLDGNIVWKVGTGLGNSSQELAVDGGILFNLGRGEYYSRSEIVRLRTSDGVFDNWKGLPSASLVVPSLWADRPDKANWPQAVDGMDARDGKLFLAFSGQTFYAPNVTDWQAFAKKLLEDSPLNHRLLDLIDDRATQRLRDFVAGKAAMKQLGQGRNLFDSESIKALNKLLSATDLVAGSDSLTPVARATANRQFIEAQFPGVITPLKTNFIAICDAHSGKVLKTIPAPAPQSLRSLGGDRVVFISDGTSVQSLNTATGALQPLVTGLDKATALASGADGKLYVALAGTTQQVKVFTAEGRPAGTIGVAGGRRLVGPWQPEGVFAPAALAVDNTRQRLWVAEADFYPKRFSVWTLADGKLFKDFFGATHYGNSGSAINPLDPNIMVATGCEWRLDPATGRSVLTGVFSRSTDGFAAFCPAPNGRLYLATIFEVQHNKSGLRIYERLGEGRYVLRSEWRPDFAAQTTTVWSDINGDATKDANEITVLPYTIQLHGSNCWSMNLNPKDFTLFGGVGATKPVPGSVAAASRSIAGDVKVAQTISNTVYRINPAGFTACGAPKWDLAAMEDLSYVWNTPLASGGFGMLPSADNRLLLTVGNTYFRCYDLTKKTELWSYPNPFYQVHGSHLAPPPVAGVTRGAYGAVGTFKTPTLGTTWVINGNCGEWYMLTEKGYYLGNLFQGDVMKMHYPEAAVPGADMTNAPSGSGGEDFGGSVTQAADGTVYIEAGKTAAWNIVLSGLDRVTVVDSGNITLKPDELDLARQEKEAQLQSSAGNKLAEIKRRTPTVADTKAKLNAVAAIPLSYDKGDQAAVRSILGWDDTNLYLGWDVTDNTPWVNGATDPAQLYLSGDTVDFQFGSDPKANPKRSEAVAGDLRISIGNFQGKPTAVLYRAVSAEKKPRSFTSGVIANYPMDYVDVIPDAQIKVTPRPAKKGYLVEATIPWSALKFTPVTGLKYQGDFGVTYGNEAGSRTRLRVYWSNQETGLVDDAVFELKMVPRNWGTVIFQP